MSQQPKKTERKRILEMSLCLNPSHPGKGVWQLHTCGSSKVDTQDENQENHRSHGEGLHGAVSRALHSLHPTSSYPSQNPFYGDEQSLKLVPDNFKLRTWTPMEEQPDTVRRRLESEEMSSGARGGART